MVLKEVKSGGHRKVLCLVRIASILTLEEWVCGRMDVYKEDLLMRKRRSGPASRTFH
jgi:hypothetical protein